MSGSSVVDIDEDDGSCPVYWHTFHALPPRRRATIASTSASASTSTAVGDAPATPHAPSRLLRGQKRAVNASPSPPSRSESLDESANARGRHDSPTSARQPQRKLARRMRSEGAQSPALNSACASVTRTRSAASLLAGVGGASSSSSATGGGASGSAGKKKPGDALSGVLDAETMARIEQMKAQRRKRERQHRQSTTSNAGAATPAGGQQRRRAVGRSLSESDRSKPSPTGVASAVRTRSLVDSVRSDLHGALLFSHPASATRVDLRRLFYLHRASSAAAARTQWQRTIQPSARVQINQHTLAGAAKQTSTARIRS